MSGRWPRRGDWEAALAQYITEREAIPYAWGEHDCAMFAAGAVVAITGKDPVPDFRGRYSTAHGSVRALQRYGDGTLEATLDTRFDVRPIACAKRGDLAFHDGSVGIVMGPFALFVGDIDDTPGLIRVPRAQWQKAWAVE